VSQDTTHRLRLLLVDDHTLFRESLSRLLESEPDFEMVGHCAAIEDAIGFLREHPIDLVLLDFDLGEGSASDFLSRARALGLATRVLMVTAGMSDSDSAQLLSQGVSGIFLKHSSPALLAQAIRKVAAGETWIEPGVLSAVAELASQPERRARNRHFTEREREVLRGVFEGLSNKEIGVRLSISESSVKAALQQLFQKTGVRTRSQLVRVALEQHGGEWKPRG
jgi:DNA-binding NarL/FixJ family response regulator